MYCTIFSSPDSPEAEDEKKHVDGEKKYEESQKQDLQYNAGHILKFLFI